MPEIQPQRPIVGVILLLMKEGKLLLQQRKGKDGLEGFYAPIAGKVDQFECPSDAAIREAQEEAGIVVDKNDLSLAVTLHWANRRREDVVEFYFTATKWQGDPKIMEPDRAASIDFYPVKNLPDKTVSSIPRVLEAIEKSQHYLEWRGEL